MPKTPNRAKFSPSRVFAEDQFGTPRTLRLLALLVMLSAAYAQTEKPASTGKDNSVYVELSKAPRKAEARQNPLATDPDAIAAGAKLFGLHCAQCHGETAAGGKKAPSLRVPEVQQAAPGTLFWLLTNGVVRRGMPVWSKLPEPQRWQLVSYIKSLSPTNRAVEDGKATQQSGSSPRPPGQRP